MSCVLIPMIRKTMPDLIAKDIVGVQPMTSEVGEMFSMKYIEGYRKHDRFGTLSHFFIGGWHVCDGKGFIPLDEFVKRYPDIHFEELANLHGDTKWRIK